MKKLVSLILVLISVMCLFSSCGTSDDLITAENGKQYAVMREDDGNIVVNGNGKLGVYTLNENGKKQKDGNGEYISEYIDFNGQVVIGKTIETVEMRFNLPTGFEVDADNIGHFTREGLKAEIFFTYYRSDFDSAVKNAEKNSESLLESYGSSVFSYEKYTLDVDGTECVAFKQRSTSSEFYKNSFVYLFPYDNGYYIVNCTVSTDYENKVDYDKFISSIELK